MKILVGIPLERNVHSEAFLCFWEIARQGWHIIHHGYGRTDANRNEMARTFLESDATHLVMLDDDHLHPPDIVQRLARWALKDTAKYEVVGGLNFKRGEPYFPCMFAKVGGDYRWPVEWPRAMGKVDALGHGAIMIARTALERLTPPFWKYEYLPWGDRDYISEDMYFCKQCEAAGIALWCDTTITSPHITDRFIDEKDYRAYLAAHPPTEVIEVDALLEAV